MSQEVTKPINGNSGALARTLTPAAVLAHYLDNEANRKKLENSLSGSLPVGKFLQISMNAIRGNWKLEQSDPKSVLACLLQCAELQLFPGGALGHAYLIPFEKGRGTGNIICTFILGYKGMLALCHRSDKVLKVEGHTVHEGDEFEVSHGVGGTLLHKPDPWGERSFDTCLGAYAIAHLANGEAVHVRMPKAELVAVRKRSKAANNGPWVTDTLAMCCKSAVRKLAAWLPLEPVDQQAIADDEAQDLGYAKEAPRDVESDDVRNPADQLNAAVEKANGTAKALESTPAAPTVTIDQGEMPAEPSAEEVNA